MNTPTADTPKPIRKRAAKRLPDPRLWMTVDQVAARLGCVPATIWKWARRDDTRFPKGYKMGGKRLWKPEEISDYIKICRE